MDFGSQPWGEGPSHLVMGSASDLKSKDDLGMTTFAMNYYVKYGGNTGDALIVAS